MCLYPKLIKNRKYTPNKKNEGVIPMMKDHRTQYVPIGCQKCMECRKQKAREWQIRLFEEVKEKKNGKFITLTFSNESIKEITEYLHKKGIHPKGYNLDNQIATTGMRLFLERWRKEHGKSLRHWMVTEIGHNGTKNIHMHGIIWTNSIKKKDKIIKWEDQIQQIWKYGYVWKGKQCTRTGRIENYVNQKTVNYIIKYVSKIDHENKGYKSIVLTSAGIGSNYTKGYNATKNVFNGKNTQETYRTDTGHKISMPIYWRNKIYSEEEREQLWLQRLDKQERWVDGIKVSVKNGEEEYMKLLKYKHIKNIELGYGTDEKISWQEQIYLNEIRQLKINTRIAKAWKKETAGMKEYDPKAA